MSLLQTDYRRDIDGLRAIAVLSVVIFHAFPTLLPGGFVGVDIFFVISGYLISSIIFKGLAANTFSFSDFYIRRVRRIFPTLLLMLFFVALVGWLMFTSSELYNLSKHITAGSLFSSNFMLFKDVGYFDTNTELKPLLHLWSLAIEEQYYFIWPLAMWLIWKIKKFRLVFILAAACLSFGLNIYFLKERHEFVFYMPFTRVWELHIGAILAYLTLYHPLWLKKIPQNIQSYLGLSFIIIALFAINKQSFFPGFWALFPTFGSALLINSGLGATINRQFLGHPFVVFIGLISYPLYLWHWPMLSFTYILEHGEPLILTRLFDIMMAIIFAYLSYRFVEKPLRFGGNAALKTTLLGSAMACFTLFGAIGFYTNGYPQRVEKSNVYGMEIIKNTSRSLCPLPKDLKHLSFYCTADTREKATNAVLGDSHALHLYDGLIATSSEGHRWALYANMGCPPMQGLIVTNDKDCVDFNKLAIQALADNKDIKNVVIATYHYMSVFGKSSLQDDPEKKIDTYSNAYQRIWRNG